MNRKLVEQIHPIKIKRKRLSNKQLSKNLIKEIKIAENWNK